jgi:hypothetical protein
MIDLYVDAIGIVAPEPGSVLVEGVADYAPAYACMAAAIHAGETLTVIVRHATCAAWFRVAAQQYGSEHIHVETITYRGQLAARWGVEVPAWVRDADIAAAGLLDVKAAKQPGQRFEQIILEHFYTPLMAYNRLPLRRLGDLTHALAQADPDQAPLVCEVYTRQLATWRQAAVSESERLLINGLARDPAALAHELMHVKVLAGYPPEVGRRALGARYDALAAPDLNLTALPVDENTVAGAVDQIRVHLNTLRQTLPPGEALDTMLDQVSGYLVAEWDAVSALLGGDIPPKLARRLQRKFAPVQSRVAEAWATLNLEAPAAQQAGDAPKPLTVRLLADEFRYRVKSLIRLELVNPNLHACEDVRATITNDNVKAETGTLDELAALSQTELHIEARIGQGNTDALHVRVDYHYQGRAQRQDIMLPVKMKQMMTTTFDLSKL